MRSQLNTNAEIRLLELGSRSFKLGQHSLGSGSFPAVCPWADTHARVRALTRTLRLLHWSNGVRSPTAAAGPRSSNFRPLGFQASQSWEIQVHAPHLTQLMTPNLHYPAKKKKKKKKKNL